MEITQVNDRDTDRHLIASVLEGDMRAFEALYMREKGRVYALCFRMVGQAALAEELTQEAFVQAWRKLDQFRGDSKFSTWLYRITTNLVLDRVRLKKHAFEQNMDELDENLIMPSDHPDTKRDLESGISRLPDGARMVFVLYEIQGHTHEEIANLLGVAVGTSKAQLHRAKKLMRNWLEL